MSTTTAYDGPMAEATADRRIQQWLAPQLAVSHTTTVTRELASGSRYAYAQVVRCLVCSYTAEHASFGAANRDSREHWRRPNG